ncbi:C-type lectin domain family 4 member M [Austrofundulus limnaeus]|uniref:C-type lectin domain family 4 member M n=1 Tax=Austrofundulus limnaeus TaxID=52670 RepID=A0A2I4BKM7_AUSLI|nr:PREDICTED: C-type lectin domain family 4 member M-like [Austrofundulus limnaeus]
MEDKEIPAGSYKQLTRVEETTEDELPLHLNQEQRVTMSTLRPESSLNTYKLLVASLAVLAAILLAVDIGLGVYYSKLTDGNIVSDLNREIAKLQTSYNAAVRSRDEAQKQLEAERKQQQVTRWEHAHVSTRIKDYEKQVEKVEMEIASLKSHLPMIREGCRHCLPGWTFLSSRCFYFPFSNTIYRTTWQEARQFCQRLGSDLAVIDTREKNLAVNELVRNNQDSSRSFYQNGFWIGLTDTEEEGVWKWITGLRLNQGFWHDGEPNNNNNEDCVAVYPNFNPFLSWNDAPCSYNLMWICETSPRATG